MLALLIPSGDRKWAVPDVVKEAHVGLELAEELTSKRHVVDVVKVR